VLQPHQGARDIPPIAGHPTILAKLIGRRFCRISQILAIAVGAICAAGKPPSVQGDAPEFATSVVECRDFVRSLRVQGTVEAVRADIVIAPRLAAAGGSLLITKLVRSGRHVKPGDLLVEFDGQTQEKAVLDRQTDYLDLVEQIRKKEAEQKVVVVRDETALKEAENALESARLDLARKEILSRIDAEKNQQHFEEAQARLAQLKDTFLLKREAARAELRILEIRRDRARDTVEYTRQNLAKMSIRTRLAGIAVLNPIYKVNRLDDPQEGDEVRPGMPLLQVVDPAAMQVRARVNQADVPFLKEGQRVRVHLDAYPDLVLPGTLEQIGAIGVIGGMSPRIRSFPVVFSIDGISPKLLPDLTAAVDIELERIAKAIVIPRDALHSERGASYVVAKSGSSLRRIAVKVVSMDDCDAAVETGPDAGMEIVRDLERHPSIWLQSGP
jgi:multidrug efflux pump subunit AcrA (membrane-fusion protein)